MEWLFNGNIGEKPSPAYFTYVVAGLCILMYLVQWMMGAGPFDSDWALVRVARSLGGEVPIWGHLVRGFMHGGIIHLGMNMLVLLTSCASVERTWGTKLYAAVYLASVFGGGVCAAMLQPDATAVGASGGIFGIMGAICSFGFIRYFSMAKRLSVFDRRRVFRWVKGYGSLLMGNLYITAKLGRYGGISIGGHLGGLLAGLVLGFVALLLVPPRRDFSEKSENGETPDNPSGRGAAARDKVLSAARWCREKIVALWRSGVKGKAVCIGVVAVPAVWLLPRWLLIVLVLGAVAVLFFRSRRSEKTGNEEVPDKRP